MTPSTWLTERQRDGEIDQVPLPPDVSGELRLCGKHVLGEGRFADDDSPWSMVVCLCERHELAERYPEYVDWLDRHAPAGQEAMWFPIRDLHAPPIEQMMPFVDGLLTALRSGHRLVVHCGAGMGRAGTIAVCILSELGQDPDDAIALVAASRPGAGPEVGPQRELVGEMSNRT